MKWKQKKNGENKTQNWFFKMNILYMFSVNTEKVFRLKKSLNNDLKAKKLAIKGLKIKIYFFIHSKGRVIGREREGGKDGIKILYPLSHFPNGYNELDCAWLKPGARSLLCFRHVGVGAQGLPGQVNCKEQIQK